MNITASDICNTIEKNVLGTSCVISPTGDQIAVIFAGRPDTVIHLLTPYYRMRLNAGEITEEDVGNMVEEVRSISVRKALADVIIDDLNNTLGALQ